MILILEKLNTLLRKNMKKTVTFSFALGTFGVILLTGCAQKQPDQSQSYQQQAPASASAPVMQNSTNASQEMVYTSAYGFTITLPGVWKNYTVKNRILDWEPAGTSDSLDFGFAAQDSLFNISIHTKAQWQAIKKGEGPTPTYLGENAKYIFGYSTAQFAADKTMTARMKETQEILKTFKIS